MATSIIKRSGKKEQYQGYKIEEAIRKAFHSSGTSYNRSIYEEVEAKLSLQDSAPERRSDPGNCCFGDGQMQPSKPCGQRGRDSGHD